jgi:hypothetical protein
LITGTVGVPRQLLDLGVREGADHDPVDVARQHARRVGDRLAAAELHVARREEQRVAAQLERARLERHARARRRLHEDHRQRPPGERPLAVLAAAHALGEREQRVELGARQVGDGEEVAVGRWRHRRAGRRAGWAGLGGAGARCRPASGARKLHGARAGAYAATSPTRPPMDRRSFLRASTHAAVGFGILRTLPAPRVATAAAPAPFAALRERYFVRSLALNPVTATYLGGDAYAPALADVNGRLRDARPAALAREAAFHRETARGLGAIRPASLDARDRVDHALMSAQLAFLLRQHARRYHERAVDTYVAEPFRGVDWQLQQMTDAGGGRLGTEAEWRQVVRRLQAVPAYVRAAEANLRAGRTTGNLPDRRMVQRDGIDGSAANAEYFARTLPGLARGFLGDRPFAARMLADLTAAAGGAARALRGLRHLPARDLRPDGSRRPVRRRRRGVRVARAHRARRPAQRRGAAPLRRRTGGAVRGQDLRRGPRHRRRGRPRRRVEHAARAAGERARASSSTWPRTRRSDDELFRLYREAGARAVAYGASTTCSTSRPSTAWTCTHAAGAPLDDRRGVLPRPAVQALGRGAAST